MATPESQSITPQPNVVGFHELPLGPTVLRVFRKTVDIEDILPNPRQPRRGAKEDEELQRQLIANEGIFQPLLVEPHPERDDKYQIIDGERRWTNARVLVKQGKTQFRDVPVEITDRTLSDEERLRVWVFIHRQRKEWDTREKETVAYALVDLVGRASAANILGTTVRDLDKLVDVFELSEKFINLREPGGAITWARELMGVSKKLLTPTVMDSVIDKVNQKRITNSKDIRKLRKILRDPVAKEHFLKREGDIESALLRVTTASGGKLNNGLSGELESIADAVKRVPWIELENLKGNAEILKKIDDAEALLQSLRNTLSD